MVTIQKTISVSPEFEKLRIEHRLSWSEAAKMGLSLQLAEMGILEYDHNLNILKKIQKLNQIAEKSSQELEKLKEYEKCPL